MKDDKTTCWYDKDVYNEMLRGARGELFPVLEKSDHFVVLKKLMERIPKTHQNLLDIGCGAADVSRVFYGFRYTGADLPGTIENVAKVLHPENTYIDFNIYEDDLDFISEYDSILMNAFIDVMKYPLECLEMVLTRAKGYVILHRQAIGRDIDTYVVNCPSYGEKDAYMSVINESDFYDVLIRCGFVIEKQLRASVEQQSYLLRKI